MLGWVEGLFFLESVICSKGRINCLLNKATTYQWFSIDVRVIKQGFTKYQNLNKRRKCWFKRHPFFFLKIGSWFETWLEKILDLPLITETPALYSSRLSSINTSPLPSSALSKGSSLPTKSAPMPSSSKSTGALTSKACSLSSLRGSALVFWVGARNDESASSFSNDQSRNLDSEKGDKGCHWGKRVECFKY